MTFPTINQMASDAYDGMIHRTSFCEQLVGHPIEETDNKKNIQTFKFHDGRIIRVTVELVDE